MKKETLSIVLFILFSTGCGTTDQDNSTEKIIPEEWKEVTLGKYHTQIPEEWVIEKATKRSEFIFYAPKISKQDKFREKVDLSITKLPVNNKNLDSYIAFRKNKLAGSLEKQSDIKTEKDFRDGRDYQIITYSGETSGYLLKFEERIWIDEGKAYILTFTAEEHEFENYKNDARLVMNGIME